MKNAGSEESQLFESVFENSGIAIALVEPSGKLFRVNNFFCTLLGYSIEEMKAMTFAEFTHPDDVDADVELYKELIEGRRDYYQMEKRYIAKEGNVVWADLSVSLIKDSNGQPEYGIGMVKDITERKVLSKEKKNAQQIFKSVFNSTFSFMGLLEKDGTIIEINKPALEFSGFKMEDVRGLLLEEADWWPTEKERELAKNAVKKASNGELVRLDLDVLGGDGSILRIDFSIMPIIDESGDVLYLVPEGRDITEREQFQKEKEEQERIFRSIFDSTFNFTGLLEPDGTLIEANKAALDFGGFTIEQAKGLKFYDAPWWSLSKEIKEELKDSIKKAAKGKFIRYDVQVVGGNGEVITIDFSITPIFDEDGNVIYLVPEGRDITEREAISNELIRTKERLEEAQEITKIGNWNWDMIKDEITWSNQNYEVFGQPKSFKPNFEALNKLIPEEDREPFQKDVERAIENNMPHDFIHRITLKGGEETRYIHERGRVFYNEEGEPIRMAGTSQDVTNVMLKELELEAQAAEVQRGLDLLSETQNAAKIGSWEVDLTTSTPYWSNEVYRIHEVEIGTPINLEEAINFYREDFREIIQNVINNAIENKSSWDVECILVTGKGNEVWVRATGHPVFEQGELIGLRGLFMNIDEKKRKAIELDEINRKLQLSVEAGRIAIWIWDLETNQLDWNDMAYEVFGVDKNVDPTFDIFGTMVHPDDLDYVVKSTQRTIEKREPLDIQFRWKRPDGDEIFLSGRGSVVLDEDGNPTQMIGINMNITERMKLVESIRLQESQLRSFVEQAPAAVAMFDNNMRYITASNKWYEHNRIEGEDIINKSHYEVLPQVQKREDWVKIHQRVLKGEELSSSKDKFIRRDGSQIWIQWTSIPWYTSKNEIGGMILYVSDITKEVEYTDQLEREIKTRTLQITEQAKSLEEVNKELESFSYSISHDLRAPLRSINGFSDILLEDYAEQLDDEGKRLIEVVKDSAITMGQLIDNILDFSRLGKKAIQKNEVDIKSLFENVVQEESYDYKDSEIKFTITELPKTVGDIALLKQVAVNLVSNALKYSSKKDMSKIIIDFEETDDNYVYSISDNGTGFKMEYHDKLFGVFQRLHSKNDFEGTGVGLAIVKRIINKHGGEIWAESKIGEGSTFFFTLPKN